MINNSKNVLKIDTEVNIRYKTMEISGRGMTTGVKYFWPPKMWERNNSTIHFQ